MAALFVLVVAGLAVLCGKRQVLKELEYQVDNHTACLIYRHGASQHTEHTTF